MLEIEVTHVTKSQNHYIEDMFVFWSWTFRNISFFWIIIDLWSFGAFPFWKWSLNMRQPTPENPKPIFPGSLTIVQYWSRRPAGQHGSPTSHARDKWLLVLRPAPLTLRPFPCRHLAALRQWNCLSSPAATTLQIRAAETLQIGAKACC